MKITFTSILILCGLVTTFSQELKKITKKSNNPEVIEEYFVLKKEKDVKHGMYQKMSNSGIVLEKGFYKNDSKDSLWIYFASNGIDTISVGTFLNDQRVGQWIIFDNKGVFSYVYNYSNGEICKYNWNGESNKFPVLVDGLWVEDEIDSPPMVMEGDKPLNKIARNIRYPTRAWKNGISGQVEVAFIVDSTGEMYKLRVKDGVDSDLDAEALRVVELLKTKTDWYPAKKNGKPLTVEYFLPVKFTLHK